MCKFATLGEIQKQQIEIRQISCKLAENQKQKRENNEIAYSKSKMGR
jgi:hypothetical protein